MRSVKDFLLEKGILPPEGARPPRPTITAENIHFIEPAQDTCSSCTVLGTVRSDFQGRYVQETLCLFGSCIEGVAGSNSIDLSRSMLLRGAHELQSRVESDLKIVPGTVWSLRKGFQVVTHLSYPPIEAAGCWKEVFFAALDGPVENPFIMAAHHLAFNRDSELSKFLFH